MQITLCVCELYGGMTALCYLSFALLMEVDVIERAVFSNALK